MLQIWKNIVLNWINCYFFESVEKEQSISADSLLAIISHLRENLNLDESKSSILEAQSIEEFLSEKYPEFKFENGLIEPSNEDEFYIVASLLLYFVCTNSKDLDIKNAMCSKLSVQDQEVILKFSRSLMEVPQVQYKDVHAAIIEACQEMAIGCPPPRSIISETPPALRSLHGEVRRLQAALDAERFDRNFLQEELSRNNLRVEKLVKDKEQCKLEILNLKAKISLCCGEDKVPPSQSGDSQANTLLRQIQDLEERLVHTQEELEEVIYDRDSCKARMIELKQEREKLHLSNQELANRIEQLQEELETEKKLSQSYKELVYELRIHNQRNFMDNSHLEWDDLETSFQSLPHNASNISEDVIKTNVSNNEGVTLKEELHSKLIIEIEQMKAQNNHINSLLKQELERNEQSYKEHLLEKQQMITKYNDLNEIKDEIETKLKNKNVFVSELQKSIKDKMAQIEVLQNDVALLNNVIKKQSDTFKQTLDSLNVQLEKLHTNESHLQEAIESHKSDVQSKLLHIQTLNEQLSQKNNAIMNLEKEITHLNQELITLRKELSQKDFLIEKLKDEYNNLDEINKSIKKLQIDTNNKLNKINSEFSILKEQHNKCECELGDKQTEMLNLLQKIDENKVEILSLQEKVDYSTRNLHKCNDELRNKDEIIHKLTIEINGLKKEVENENKECHNLEKLKAKLEHENKVIKDLFETEKNISYRIIDEKEKKMEKILDELKQKNNIIETVKKGNHELSEALNNELKRIEFIEKVKDELGHENKVLIDLLETVKKSASASIEEKQTEINKLLSSIAQKETVIGQMEQEKLELHTLIKEHLQEKQETMKKYSELNDTKDEIESKLKSKNVLVNELQTNIKGKNDQIEVLQNDVALLNNVIKKQSDSFKQTLDKLNVELEKLHKNESNLQEATETLKSDIQSKMLHIQNLDAQLSQKNNTIANSDKEINYLNQELITLRKEQSLKEYQLEKLKDEFNVIQDTLKKTKQLQRDTENKLHEVNGQYSILKEQQRNIELELDEKKTETLKLLRNAEEDNAERLSLQQHVDTLTHNLQKCNNELLNKEDDIKKLTMEIKEIKKEIGNENKKRYELEELQVKLEHLNQELLILKKDQCLKDKEIEELKEKYDDLQEKHKEIQQLQRDTESKLSEVNTQCSILKEKESKIEYELDDKKTEVLTHIQKIEENNAEILTLQNVVETLTNNLQECNNKLLEKEEIIKKLSMETEELNKGYQILEELKVEHKFLNEELMTIKKEKSLRDTQLEELKNEYNNLQEIHSEIKQLHYDTENKLHEVNNQNSILKEQLSNVEQELDDKNTKVSKFLQKLEENNVEILSLQEKVESSKRDLQKCNDELLSKDETIIKLTMEIQDLKNAIKNNNNVYHALEELKIKLESEVFTLRQEQSLKDVQIEKQKNDNNDLQETLTEMQKLQKDTESKLCELNSQYSILKEHQSNIDHEVDDKKSEIVKLLQQIEEKNVEILSLQEKVDSLTNDTQKCYNQLLEKDAIIKKHTEDIKDLKIEKDNNDKLLRDLEDKLEYQNQELIALKKEQSVKDKELEQIKIEYNNLQDTYKDIQQLQKDTENKFHEVNSQYSTLKEQQNNIQNELDDKKTEILQLLQTIKEHNNEILALQENVKKLTNIIQKYNDELREKDEIIEKLRIVNKDELREKDEIIEKLRIANNDEIEKLRIVTYDELREKDEIIEKLRIANNDVEEKQVEILKHLQNIDENNTEILSLQQKVEFLTNNLQKCNDEVVEKDKIIQKLSMEIVDLQQEIENENLVRHSLEKIKMELENENKITKDLLETEKNTAYEMINEKEKKIENILKELQQKNNLIETIKKDNRELSELLNHELKLKESIEIVKEEMNHKNKVLTDLLESVKISSSASINEKQTEIDNLLSSIAQKETIISEIEKEKHKLNSVINRQLQEIVGYSERISELEGANNMLKDLVETEKNIMKTAVQKVESQAAEYLNKLHQKDELLEILTTENQELKDNIANYVEQKRAIEEKYNDLKEVEANLQSVIQENNLHIQMLVQELSDIKNDKEQLEAKLTQEKDAVGSMNKELLEEKGAKEKIQNELQIKTVAVVELRQKLSELIKEECVKCMRRDDECIKAAGQKETLIMASQEKSSSNSGHSEKPQRMYFQVDNNSPFDNTQSSLESYKTISDLEKIILDKNRTITTLQSDLTYMKSLMAESENKLLDVSKELEITKESHDQVSNQLKKIVNQKNDEIADLKKQLNKLSFTENRATEIIKLSAKYQAIILKRIAEIKTNTVLKELQNFGNTGNNDHDLRRGINAGSITMDDLENFLEATERNLKRFSEKQMALQKERDRLYEVSRINESEVVSLKKFLTELSVSFKTFSSVKEIYTQKLSKVVSIQRTVRREILNSEGHVTDAAMCKLERRYAAVMQDLAETVMNVERWVERCLGRTISPEKIKQAFTSELDRASLSTTSYQNAGLEVQIEELEKSFQKLLEEVSQARRGDGSKDAQSVTVMEVRAEYEDKLNRMKAKMKQLFEEQIGKYKEKQKNEIADLQKELHKAKENLAESSRAYEEHIRALTTELWSVGEKFLIQKDEAEWLRRKHRSGSLMSLQQYHSTGLGGAAEDPSRTSDAASLRSLPVIPNINDNKPKKREGRGLHMSDEEGEVFDNRCLKELTSTPRAPLNPGRRLSELQWRNSLCPPHLKSSYPAETQFAPSIHEEDIKHSLGPNTTLPGRNQRKEVGITAYKKPGPPTPSKQAGRLSATDSELRESLRVEMDPHASRKTSTPSRLRALFRSSRNETSDATPRRRLSNIFRKK